MNNKYNLSIQVIHWITVLLFVITLGTVWLHDFDKSLMVWHKTFGLIIFVLVFIRLALKSFTKNPVIDDIKVKLGHWLLYLVMFLTPLTMLISSAYYKGLTLFGLNIIPLIEENKQISHLFKEVHEFLGNFMIALVVGHALFALWHHYVKKDNTLTKML